MVSDTVHARPGALYSPPGTLYALPGTMCDERIWSRLKEQALEFSIQHLPIPDGDTIDDIVEMLGHQLPDNNISLLGFSLGGYLAAAFCVKFPERVKHLIILSNSPSSLPSAEIILRQQLINWLKDKEYTGMGSKRINSLLHPDNMSDTLLHNIISLMDIAGGKTMLLKQLNATTRRQDLSENLRSSNTPITFIYGEADSLVDESLIASICRSYKDKRYHKIEGAGHMLPLEQAHALALTLNTLSV